MKKYLLLLVITIVTTSISFAQVDIGLKGIGGKLSYIMPEDPIDDTIGLGVNADLGTITPAIHLNGFIDYWGKTYEVGLLETTFSEFLFGATAKYYIQMEGQFEPYVGGGLAFIIGRSSWEYKGAPSPYIETSGSDSDTDIGIHFCGGADYKISDTMTGFGEIKYNIDGFDYLAISAGVIYYLGK